MIYDFTNLKDNLESKGYKVSVFTTKESATEYLDSQIDEREKTLPTNKNLLRKSCLLQMKVRERLFQKKLREFITTRLALQEMLMIVAHVETKEYEQKI